MAAANTYDLMHKGLLEKYLHASHDYVHDIVLGVALADEWRFFELTGTGHR